MEMFFTRIKNLYHTMQGENTWSEVVDMHSYRWGTTTDIYRLLDYHTWIVIDCPTQGSASLAIRNYLEFNLGQSQLTHSPMMWNKWLGSDCERLSWFFCILCFFNIFLIDRWTNHASSSYWELNDIHWYSINFNNIFQDSSISITSCKFIQGLWSQ